MNICLINTNKAWGGGEKWHFEMALNLKRRGHKITVITHEKSELQKKLQLESISTKSFNIGKLSFLNPFACNTILKYFNSNSFDAIVLNLPIDVKSFAKPAFKSGIKKIIYRRGMNHPIKGTFLNKRIYPHYISDFIANSEDVKKSIFKNIPELERKIHIIYNGIKSENIKPLTNKVSNKKILIGNLGRLVEQKGQADLIELAKNLKIKNKDFQLYIAGEGPLREELQSKIKRYDLENQVHLMGMQPPAKLFEKIDIFVFSSKFEGLSNALLESLQYGKPVICYDTASNSEIISDGQNGFLIEPNNIEQFTEKVIQLAENTESYQQMQLNGQEVLQKKFDQDKMINKLIKVLTA